MAAIKVHIIYENGKLRLLEPVELKEGQILEATVVEDNHSAKKGRTPNLHPHTFEMSDDFDSELPDSFWLGEDK